MSSFLCSVVALLVVSVFWMVFDYIVGTILIALLLAGLWYATGNQRVRPDPFASPKRRKARSRQHRYAPSGMESCFHLISGVAVAAAAIARIRRGRMPIEADDSLSHAGNFIYMMTDRKPDPMGERLMDIALILHADHGMNGSTFASMVVASTLSDIYFCIGTGIAALSGPLHGGANEQVIHLLEETGSPENVPAWYKKASKNEGTWNLYRTAEAIEKEVVSTLGKEKKIFPNVDFYSDIVYT